MHLTRRLAIAMVLAVAACGSEPPAPQNYPEPSYDYLPQIRVGVAEIEIDDSWAPRGAGRQVGDLAPTPPRAALRRMAQDRLFASGGPGKAVYVIDDASILRASGQYVGNFAVRVDVADASGNLLTSAVARATRTHAIGGGSANAVRSDLYALVGDLMGDMNVELEYQLRRALKEAPQATAPISPRAEPVQVQDLSGPNPPVDPSRTPGGQQLSPPPRDLPGGIPLVR